MLYTVGITKRHEIMTYFFSLCLFLSVYFHAVKGIQLEPTKINELSKDSCISMVADTGKSLSEALIFAEHGENILCT